MKRLVLFFVLALFTVTSWGDDLTIEGVMYSLDKENRVAEVVRYDGASAESSSLVIPSMVVNDGLEYKVTGIGKMAFANSSLASVTLPESLEVIGDGAFRYCAALKSIVIPNAVKSIGGFAFATSGIESLTIGNAVESIGERAFAFCSDLTAVRIPKSVRSIGDYLLGYDGKVTSITVEDGNSVYDSRENCNAIIETATNTLIEGCAASVIPNSVTRIGCLAFCARTSLSSIVIPESVTTIDDDAFSNTALTSVIIPNSVTTIGNNTFYGCSMLTSVTLGKSLASIGESAFQSCRRLESVNIPESVTGIGAYAFSGCVGITSVSIPAGVTCIEDGTFNGCSRLSSVTLPETLTSIGENAFASCAMQSIDIPATVTNIGKAAFSRSLLTSVAIPDGITVISDHCFYFSDLTSVTIPESVKKIGAWSFAACSSLRAITIPGSVTEIGIDAFSGCSSLADITCLALTPPATMNYMGNYRVNLHVLPGCKKAYMEASYWKDFNVLEDAVAGIDGVQMSADNAIDKIYSASGLLLPGPQRGLNIINGKKVLRQK